MYVLLIETNEYQPENGEWFLELAGTRPAAKKMWERRKIKKEAFESAAAHVIWLLQPTIYRSSSGWYTQSAMFKLKKVIKIFIDGLNVGIFAYFIENMTKLIRFLLNNFMVERNIENVFGIIAAFEVWYFQDYFVIFGIITANLELWDENSIIQLFWKKKFKNLFVIFLIFFCLNFL